MSGTQATFKPVRLKTIMITPTRTDFYAATEAQPLSLTLPHWEQDPFELYRRLANNHPISFLLESGKGPNQVARYSFMGCDPYLMFSARGDEYELWKKDGIEMRTGQSFEALAGLLRDSHISQPKDLPPFFGGAVGYFGYDVARQFEHLPNGSTNELDLPDMLFAFFDLVAALDHETHSLVLIFAPPRERFEGEAREKLYREGCDRLAALEARLSVQRETNASLPPDITFSFQPGMPPREYQQKVRQCQAYIRSGDIYQANLSHRFTLEFDATKYSENLVRQVSSSHLSTSLYERLRHVNPSPFAGILQFEDFSLISSSPERLVRLHHNQVDTRPIAGTRPRGHTLQEDRQLTEELLTNHKERAEHLMLVDLGRNDIGRVSTYGSVQTDEFMVVERYSHVSHIVSNVRGTLRPGLDGFDLIRAVFPGGTITGVPKIRCMEILDMLEPYRRGPYTGSMGYLSWSGDVDLNIIIRTLVLKGNRGYLQVGAGIVADSDPRKEYEETLLKAQAFFNALGTE